MGAQKLVLWSLAWGLVACKVATFPMHEPLYPAACESVQYSLTVDTDAIVNNVQLYERVREVDETGVVDPGKEELIATLWPGFLDPSKFTFTVSAGYPENRLVTYRFEVDRYMLPDVSHSITFAIRPYPVQFSGGDQPVPAPVYCQGAVRSSIDIVFVPDKDLSTDDPTDDELAEFRAQGAKMITESMWNDPTLRCWMRSFNYFINPLMGKASPHPGGGVGNHELPDNQANLSFAEVRALMHKTYDPPFRDWWDEFNRALSTELSSRWTFLHELGHGGFGLSDEYDNAEAFYEPGKNLWWTEPDAQAAASKYPGKSPTKVDQFWKLCRGECQMNDTTDKTKPSTFDSPCADGIHSELRKLVAPFLPPSYSCISALFALAGCDGADEPFDPEYFKTKHFVLLLTLERGDLLLPPMSIDVRPGPSPYRPSRAGPVTLRALDSAGTELYRWEIQDPRIRAPDGELGFPFPADTRIADVEIGPLDGRTYTFDVEAGVQDAIHR